MLNNSAYHPVFKGSAKLLVSKRFKQKNLNHPKSYVAN